MLTNNISCILIFVCDLHYTACPCPEIETTTACDALLISNAPTLNRAAALLGQGQVLLTQQVDRLVLVNLHAGAHVTVSMYEECEGAGQVFTAEKEQQMEDYSRALELQPGRK